MTKHFTAADWVQVSDGVKYEIDINGLNGTPIIQTYQKDGNTVRHMPVPTIIVDNIIRLELNNPIEGYVVIIFDKEE